VQHHTLQGGKVKLEAAEQLLVRSMLRQVPAWMEGRVGRVSGVGAGRRFFLSR